MTKLIFFFMKISMIMSENPISNNKKRHFLPLSSSNAPDNKYCFSTLDQYKKINIYIPSVYLI